MRRKFELEEEMRVAAIQTSSEPPNLMGYAPAALLYPDHSPSPVPAFTKPDQVPTISTCYWPPAPSRDMTGIAIGQKPSPDKPFPDFSEWLGTTTHLPPPSSIPLSVAYQSFDLPMSLSYQETSHASAPVYSLVDSHSCNSLTTNAHNPAHHHLAMSHHQSAVGQSTQLQQLKQVSAGIRPQQPMLGYVDASQRSASDLSHQLMLIDYQQCQTDVLRVCPSMSSSFLFS